LNSGLSTNIEDEINSKMHQFFFISNKGICFPIGNWIQSKDKHNEKFLNEKIKMIIELLSEYEINNFQWTSTDAEIGNDKLSSSIKQWWKGDFYEHFFDYIHLIKSLRNQLIPPQKSSRIIGIHHFNIFTLRKAIDSCSKLAELIGDEIGK